MDAKVVTIISSFVLMFCGLVGVLCRKEKGFGPSTNRALGIVLLIPSIIVLAVGLDKLSTETVATLIGAIAGYVLSSGGSETEGKARKPPRVESGGEQQLKD